MFSAITNIVSIAPKLVLSEVARMVQDREGRLQVFVVENAKDNDPESVLQTIDAYCWQHRWMMHLGDEKRQFLEQVLKDAAPINTALELGLYCGYSATTIARYLEPGGKLYSVEPAAKHREVATAILQKGGLVDKVEIVAGKGCDMIGELAKKGLVFDFVFIDHQKDQYYPDLLLLEEKGLMREGTVVVADNVVVFKTTQYLDHVRNSGRYKSSVLHMAHVEYDNNMPDGLEVSIYAGNAS